MDGFDLATILQIIGPALAVYVGIRSDIAAMHIRLDHIERDLYAKFPQLPKR